MSKLSEACDRFVAHLEGLRDRRDRAALARLRRGLGRDPGAVADLHPLVQPYLPRWLSPRQEDGFYLVASLFASHPEAGGRGDFGAAFARLAAGRASAGAERRLTALLDAHADDLPRHLRHAVSLLAAGAVPVDWRKLLEDVLAWNHPRRRAQRAWARSFWGTVPETPTP